MKLALFDLDGTLSDDSARQQAYVEKRWSDYFSYEAQMADPVYPEARALFDQMVLEGWTIGYLTARLERNRQATEDWIKKNGFVETDLTILRPEADADVRPPEFKCAVVRDFVEHSKFEKVVLIENDPIVAEHIRCTLGAEHVFLATWDKNQIPAS